jgi:hypothetical protein
MSDSTDRLTWIAIAGAIAFLVLTRHNHVSHEWPLYPAGDVETVRSALSAHAQSTGAEYARSQQRLRDHSD